MADNQYTRVGTNSSSATDRRLFKRDDRQPCAKGIQHDKRHISYLNRMICPAHPLDFVLNFLARHPRVTDVFLSTYRSHPESLIDDRETYRIDANKLQLKYD